MASLYSDGSIYLPGSKDPQGPAGTGHCHCVGLVWAPEVLETCLGILGIWHLSQESTDMHGSGRECGRAPLGLLLPRNPWLFWCRSWWHPPLTMRSHSHHTFSRSLAWSVYGRATLWTLVAPGQQTPLSGLPKVSHFLTILASTVFFKS